MTKGELKKAISNYALSGDLPVEEFVKIATCIDTVYERLALADAALEKADVAVRAGPGVMDRSGPIAAYLAARKAYDRGAHRDGP